ncbi:FUSC family protein [Sulfoacidibacillus ferrooxidans]|uniref:Inner membrane protein YccS n=1 Tax=Sulfoacidibacillus ferrooxidans TaxID=2005001 RepID=A0A9X2ABX4_9BACL|nr:FUSC family protein [Sulfoacidibacillus ferrooxidans]MCI0183234.1 Inner membrane protein YccS [Sulfoacidibacillus ferrooxidans]
MKKKKRMSYINSLLRLDMGQITWRQALRNALGISLPLIAGVLCGHILYGLGGAVGALVAGFASMTGTYRKRLRTMLLTAVWMSVATFIGAATGNILWFAVFVMMISGFIAGLLVAVSPEAAQIGLLSTNSLILIANFPETPLHAFYQGLLVAAGALIQIILMMIDNAVRPSPTEASDVATVFKALSAYAKARTRDADVLVARSFLIANSSLKDSSLKTSYWYHLSHLLDIAERLRLDIVALDGAFFMHREHGTHAERVSHIELYQHLIRTVLQQVSEILAKVSPIIKKNALVDPSFADSVSQLQKLISTTMISTLDHEDRAQELKERLNDLISRLLDMSNFITSGQPSLEITMTTKEMPTLRRSTLSVIHDVSSTLKANVTLRSSAFRHAIRLSGTLTVAVLLYRFLHLPRGYWIPLTALIILKPDFFTTFSRGSARILGTLLGVAFTTLFMIFIPDSHHLLGLSLVVLFAWALYTTINFNYTIYTTLLTAEVVVLLSFFEQSAPLATAMDRLIDTAIGGILAFVAYAIWPTWQRRNVPESFNRLIVAEQKYFHAVFHLDSNTSKYRKNTRLARTNTVTVVEQALAEPVQLKLPVVNIMGLLTGLHRFADTLVALEANSDTILAPYIEQPDVQHFIAATEAALNSLEQLLVARMIATTNTQFNTIETSVQLKEIEDAIHVHTNHIPPALEEIFVRLASNIGTMNRMLSSIE